MIMYIYIQFRTDKWWTLLLLYNSGADSVLQNSSSQSHSPTIWCFSHTATCA